MCSTVRSHLQDEHCGWLSRFSKKRMRQVSMTNPKSTQNCLISSTTNTGEFCYAKILFNNLSLLNTTLFQCSCHSFTKWAAAFDLKSMYGTLKSAVWKDKAVRAAESAFSLPLIPTWLDSQQKDTVYPFRRRYGISPKFVSSGDGQVCSSWWTAEQPSKSLAEWGTVGTTI